MRIAASRAGYARVISEPQVGRGREEQIARDFDAAMSDENSRKMAR